MMKTTTRFSSPLSPESIGHPRRPGAQQPITETSAPAGGQALDAVAPLNEAAVHGALRRANIASRVGQALRVACGAVAASSAAASLLGSLAGTAPERLPAVLIQGVAGLLGADLAAAAIHWFEDNYLPPRPDLAPALRGIAVYNEVHHLHPAGIVDTTYLEGAESVFAPIMMATIALQALNGLNAGAVGFLAGSLMANEIHRWAHMPGKTRPAIATWLQKLGLVQRPATHNIHHRTPDRNYAIMFEGTNRLYDALGLWSALETLIEKTVGKRPEPKGPIGQSNVPDLKLDLTDLKDTYRAGRPLRDALADCISQQVYGAAPAPEKNPVREIAQPLFLLAGLAATAKFGTK